jgi:hypothetical protein
MPATAANIMKSQDTPPAPTSVWAWTGRRYRIRAVVLLLLNLLVFCCLCVFTNWLHLGHAFDFGLASYLEPLRFWGPQTQSLYDFVLQPISVDEVPVYGVVIGLLVATVVAVPISVSIVYGFRCALPFCAAVFVLAHMPWMGITLVACCVLASVPPFRMQFRFASALVALLPVLLYLYLATRGAAAPLSASISPESRLLLLGPWLLATLAASLMLGAVVLIARVVRYRPGAVAPVMAIMFATPLVLFQRYVGADEVAYRVLESEYGPRSPCFEPRQDASADILAFVHSRTQRGTDEAAQRYIVRALWSGRSDEALSFKQRISNHLQVELMKDRQAAYYACREFITDHRLSPYIPNVLYMQARVLDTRLDEVEFLGDNTQRRLYADFPHVQSEPIWTTLLRTHPDSPLALAARLRVAQLRLRKGDARTALEVLAEAPAPHADAASPARDTVSPGTSLGFDPGPYRFEIRRLREMIEANLPDPANPDVGVAPLQALAALDPHRPGYRVQLQRLAHEHRDTPLYPNLVVRWANTNPDLEQQVADLRACVDRFAADDALPEALFQLAEIEVQGLGDEASRKAGLERLRTITTRHADTCWAVLAAERLKVFGRVPVIATQPAESR